MTWISTDFENMCLQSSLTLAPPTCQLIIQFYIQFHIQYVSLLHACWSLLVHLLISSNNLVISPIKCWYPQTVISWYYQLIVDIIKQLRISTNDLLISADELLISTINCRYHQLFNDSTNYLLLTSNGTYQYFICWYQQIIWKNQPINSWCQQFI